MQSLSRLPVVLGSSLSGLLVSQSLSRAGIDHVLIGGERPARTVRLGESLNDTASPELWRFYGRELRDLFHYKNHIIYFNGNFSTMIHLANPRRTLADVDQYAPVSGVPRYPWFGDGLFHLDRVEFDLAIYDKVRADKHCRFVLDRVTHLEYDRASDKIARIDLVGLSGVTSIDEPRYVFDNTGWNTLVGNAAHVGTRLLSNSQRVVFTHYRRADREVMPPEFWRHGTNLIRLDKDFDGIDAIAWVIPINKTLSVGMSLDSDGPRGSEDRESLMTCLEGACHRRGIAVRANYPERVPMEPAQDLTHSYFVRDRASGGNWLLVGGTYITIWFPSSSGLWTVGAAASMAPRLLDEPALGAFYQKAMNGLIPFHHLLDGVIHGPTWKSSLNVYRFFSRGTGFIIGRVNNYLRVKNQKFGWFRPWNWMLELLAYMAWLLPTVFFILIGGMALVRSRLSPDRTQQARPFPLYTRVIPFRLVNFFRSIPQFLWALVPRKTIGAGSVSSETIAAPAAEEVAVEPPREAAS